MRSPVYASKGGRRFHGIEDCPAVERALLIHDSDEFSVAAYRVELTTVTDAFGAGKEPCAVCFPGLRAAWYRGSSENDYGHWPTRGISLNSLADDVCQRCTEWGVWYGNADDLRPVHIAWPCTSALILGLVPREVTA